jgi:hypothetical protein
MQSKQQLERDVPNLLFKEAGPRFAMAPDLAPQVPALAELHDDPNLGGLLIDYSATEASRHE